MVELVSARGAVFGFPGHGFAYSSIKIDEILLDILKHDRSLLSCVISRLPCIINVANDNDNTIHH